MNCIGSGRPQTCLKATSALLTQHDGNATLPFFMETYSLEHLRCTQSSQHNVCLWVSCPFAFWGVYFFADLQVHFTHSNAHSVACALTHLLTHLNVHPLAHSAPSDSHITHPLTLCLLIHSIARSLTISLTHAGLKDADTQPLCEDGDCHHEESSQLPQAEATTQHIKAATFSAQGDNWLGPAAMQELHCNNAQLNVHAGQLGCASFFLHAGQGRAAFQCHACTLHAYRSTCGSASSQARPRSCL